MPKDKPSLSSINRFLDFNETIKPFRNKIQEWKGESASFGVIINKPYVLILQFTN